MKVIHFLTILILVSCKKDFKNHTKLPTYFQVPPFELINEKGLNYGSKNLKRSPYIASFIFTQCTLTCPQTLNILYQLQQKLKDNSSTGKIVTFTVDPERDTPKVLREKAISYKADPNFWTFLTGDFEKVEKVITQSFRSPMDKFLDDDNTIIGIAHSEKLILVDKKGSIRGLYSLNDRKEREQLLSDMKML